MEISAKNNAPTSPLSRQEDQYGTKRFVVKQELKETKFDPMEYAKYVGEIKRAQANDIEEKVSKNLKIITALHDLKKSTYELRNSAKQLSNYLGIDNTVPNLWKNKIGTVTNTATGQSAKNLVNITPTGGSPVGGFTLAVTQVASADQIFSTGTLPDTTTHLNLTGNLVINGSSVPLTGLTLGDVATAVNALTATTNVEMNLIQTSTGGAYSWQLVSTQQSVPINLTGTDQLTLTGLHIPLDSSDPAGATPAITPTDSLLLKMTYNGQAITRSGTNFVSDLIPNTTIEVYGANTGTLNCNIDYDRQGVVDGIGNFVSTYNGFRKFVREQTAYEVDKKTPKENAHLHHNATVKSERFDIEAALNTWVSGISGTAAVNLAQIGLPIGKSTTSIGANGQVIFNNSLDGDIIPDTEMLEKLIFGGNLNQVLSVLGNNTTSSNHYFSIYSIPDFSQNTMLAGTPITVSLRLTNGVHIPTLTATPSPGNTITVTASYTAGGLITGPEGTPFEGFSIACQTAKVDTLTDTTAGGSAISTTCTATMGVMPILENSLDTYIDFINGKIEIEIQRLEADNLRNKEKADKLKDEALRDENNILKQFDRVRELEQSYKGFSEMFDNLMKVMTAGK